MDMMSFFLVSADGAAGAGGGGPRDNTGVDTTGGGSTAGLDAIFQHIASGLGARLTRHTQDDDGTVRVGATRKEGGCCG